MINYLILLLLLSPTQCCCIVRKQTCRCCSQPSSPDILIFWAKLIVTFVRHPQSLRSARWRQQLQTPQVCRFFLQFLLACFLFEKLDYTCRQRKKTVSKHFLLIYFSTEFLHSIWLISLRALLCCQFCFCLCVDPFGVLCCFQQERKDKGSKSKRWKKKIISNTQNDMLRVTLTVMTFSLFHYSSFLFPKFFLAINFIFLRFLVNFFFFALTTKDICDMCIRMLVLGFENLKNLKKILRIFKKMFNHLNSKQII